MKMIIECFLLATIFIVLIYSRSFLDHEFYVNRKIGNPIPSTEISRRKENIGYHQFQNSTRGKSPSRPLTSYVVNVDNFGAAANGSDDTQAFMKAWEKACCTRGSILLVPEKKEYHLKQIIFEGPCESGITVRIQGNITASKDKSDFQKDPKFWIKFQNLTNFTVDGGGVIIGNGHVWWSKSCKLNKKQPCVRAPTALLFSNCTNLKVMLIQIENAQQMHLKFLGCENVEVSNLKIKSPGKSPNTDGIHVTGSTNVQILNSEIGTGDDCISIVNGSYNIRAMGIKCGPGHGISIGSLGKDGDEDQVANVLVSEATFTRTSNGVRIKSWQGGRGYAKNIVFQNIKMQNVMNPIIIDQFYCNKEQRCKLQKNGVHVENVLYKNITGTSASREGVILQCSETFPCEGVKLQNVQIYHNGRNSSASCSNVNVLELGTNTPQCSSKEPGKIRRYRKKRKTKHNQEDNHQS
ncbi:OLC1v1001479C1 [Oldenlandia corymbosa var. corymbosa]|uniref:endo-polygalacturonase n=1 Tax=Oldenlandia corymbosa var. corymbosa TaxID=529605 RepID=A0AAV1D6H1_OLDCO|nr:OLC1v1001479C1 [Oldenlandia corymbosa var. corymbosa]